MVSFTSLFVVALMTASQVVESAVVRQSLPSCRERKEYAKSDHLTTLGSFSKDNSSKLARFTADPDAGGVVAIEKSSVTQLYITTIQTKEITDSSEHIAVTWSVEEGQNVIRYFELDPNTKCRVEVSAGYRSLEGAAYVRMGTALLPCLEKPELDNDYRGYNVGSFSKDDTSKLPRFTADLDAGGVVQIEKSETTLKYITTVETKDVGNFNKNLAIVWKTAEDKYVSRYFVLESNRKCRVKQSSDYHTIEGASYV